MTTIDALKTDAGLDENSWEIQLLRAADAAGNKDGQANVAELDAYVEGPRDGRFVSAGAVRRMRAELLAPSKVGVQVRSVSSFPEPWQRLIAERADSRSNGDGAVSEIELDELLARGGTEPVGTRRVSEQALAALRSRIADDTRESDTLRVTTPNGSKPKGVELLQRYARIVYDPQLRLPSIVGYVLSAADLREDVVERDGHFTTDSALPQAAQSRAADYRKQGYDLGHMRPAGDSATTEAMAESFRMSNIAPQAPNLNRQVWRQLEDAVREVVRASNGRATVFTGTLFLDERGQPISRERVRFLSRRLHGSIEQRVAIPTHCFKVVLFEQPNGAMTLVGFIVPNRDDVPTTRDGIRELLHASRRSVRDIQLLTGHDLFRDLPDTVEEPMEASSEACMAMPPGARVEAVTLLWPKDCRPQSWTMPRGDAPAPPPQTGNRFVRFLRGLVGY